MTDLAAGRPDAELLAQDEAARVRALDVRGSFLVQAPAGSGKTELLIQRYLALLACVDEPERIVAVTFTRKAAGEMRERVQRALADAQAHTPVEAPHEVTTRELAIAVLAQDARRGWELTAHPARLAMLTFDALAVSFARRAPLSSALGPSPAYVDDASMLYRLAAAAAIADARAEDPHWRVLLAHCDNDAELAAHLLADLLARRDQLLRTVRGATPAEVRTALESALAHEVNVSLRTLRNAFPPESGQEIAALARVAAEALAQDASTTALAAALGACAQHSDLPPPTLEAMPAWRTLAQWLLTGDGAFRQQVTKKQGFAAGKGAAAPYKARMQALLERLSQQAGLAAALHAAARMPARALVGEASWRVVEALLSVFPSVVARLALTFAADGRVDFIQANLAALEALGEEDAPSDLLLRLDHRVQHLLIDEFQDTSATQLALLARLTAGWTPGDGRTLFAVGDPMQSIYRFREAEVRLFVEAQISGTIAGLAVERLTLRRNFRSQRNLVDWVNAKFPAVLGGVSDPVRGSVAFAAATAALGPLHDQRVTLDLCQTVDEEAQSVVARVRAAREAGSNAIAILVRARAHLAEILPALREAGIPFSAVELDTLGQRQAVQDLLALTHAVLQPADRLAWLAVLRAPWCGLTLSDVFAVAEAVRPGETIGKVLGGVDAIAGLTSDGRARLASVANILGTAIAAQGRASVAARVRGAWLALGGPACLVDAIDLEASERFFEAIAEHEQAGDVPAWQAFVDSLQHLYAAADAAPRGAVQVMTMHKAKGLEFDTVVLPGLACKERGLDTQLLRWRSRPSGLLIAASKRRGGEHDAVYDFLCDIEKEAADSELARLLYVASTRAIARLHLVAALSVKADRAGNLHWQPGSNSSLAKLWPVIAADTPAPSAAEAPSTDGVAQSPPLERLPADYRVARPHDRLRALPIETSIVPSPPFDWAAETARRVGTIAHRLLARIAGRGLDRWTPQAIEAFAPRVRADLVGAGLTADELPGAVARVLEAVRRTLVDPRGRWLFDAAHEDARSEWAIAGMDNGEIVHLVLDRTFVAEGTRWIIDFKTGTHEGGEVAAFLDREVERYREQLARYGRLVSGLEARPVRLALYYPLVDGGFREIMAPTT